MNRKALTFSAIAASLAFGAQSSAQVTGTVNVTGTVTGSCGVNTLGGVKSFGDTIDLGSLADPASGQLNAALKAATNVGAEKTFQVICNTGQPKVTLSATRMQGPAGAAPTGMANAIDYTTALTVKTTGGDVPVSYTTAAAPPAATQLTLVNPLQNVAGNIAVRVHTLSTVGATDVLLAGSYAGVITIIISPT